MTRTDEQVAADTALEQAVHDFIRAYGGADGVLGDAIVVAAMHNFEGSQPVVNVHAVEVGEHGIPEYRAFGLLEYALTGYRTHMALGDTEQ